MTEKYSTTLKQAIELYNKKKYIEAKLEFLKVAKEESSDFLVTEAILYLGKIALRSEAELFFDAKNYLDYVIMSGNSRQKEQAYFELANKYRLLENAEESINYYQKCLKLFPEDTYCLMNLASLYLKLGKLNEAEQTYYKLIKASENARVLSKKVIGINTAYIGLAKINLRKGDIKMFLSFLNKVEIVTEKDAELVDDIQADLMFYYEKYPEAIAKYQRSLKSKSFYIREYTKEKVAVLQALNGNHKESKYILERNYPDKPLTKGGSVALANIFFQEGNYPRAYGLYLSLGYDNPKYFIDALKCAMHFKEQLAIKVINLLLLTDVQTAKYMPYLIYLSKKYNIAFIDADYTAISSLAEEFLQHDEKRVTDDATYNNQLNYREGYTWDYIFNGIIKSSLENRENNPQVTFIPDIIYDTYIIHVPFVAWNYRDYIVVKTFKSTTTPIEVVMKSKNELDQESLVAKLKSDYNVRKLFR